MNGLFPRWATTRRRTAEFETWQATGWTNPQGPITEIRFPQERYCTPNRSTAHRKWNNRIPNHWFINEENNVKWMIYPSFLYHILILGLLSLFSAFKLSVNPPVPSGRTRGLLLQHFARLTKASIRRDSCFCSHWHWNKSPFLSHMTQNYLHTTSTATNKITSWMMHDRPHRVGKYIQKTMLWLKI